jgi:hypothetical protein
MYVCNECMYVYLNFDVFKVVTKHERRVLIALIRCMYVMYVCMYVCVFEQMLYNLGNSLNMHRPGVDSTRSTPYKCMLIM